MNRCEFNKHLGEADCKTRFKLYKSGKSKSFTNWLTSFTWR
ncbi:KxYKxGKxW signal peptide domain-containing protein [Ruoffia tabacinasalis]|uniref:Uncharacterized protein n=1 Tax=Ruoffia tabacinasalis TaxID=87458 RepID=A0A5R9DT87_9LACT|nr:hypothetical protein FEZ33_09140 [Ruoffia tabacinasalis]HBY89317.1 hypothetical protein [Aerococcaceae bacterium]